MKNIKTAERNSLTDRHLANILRIKNASFDANIENTMAGRQVKSLIELILVN